jgi:hypothetical protein
MSSYSIFSDLDENRNYRYVFGVWLSSVLIVLILSYDPFFTYDSCFGIVHQTLFQRMTTFIGFISLILLLIYIPYKVYSIILSKNSVLVAERISYCFMVVFILIGYCFYYSDSNNIRASEMNDFRSRDENGKYSIELDQGLKKRIVADSIWYFNYATRIN